MAKRPTGADLPLSSKEQYFTLHQIAPYTGRLKSTVAQGLVAELTSPSDWILDPFCGSGVVGVEAVAQGRNFVGNDWNPYACLISRAKLSAPTTLESATRELNEAWTISRRLLRSQDLRRVPRWVRRFFHPNTLRSALAFRDACALTNNLFLMACLLGILHHERVGFLSYPSSNLAPYLRDRKYPRSAYPHLYTERDVYSRLRRKVDRVMRCVPEPTTARSTVTCADARELSVARKFKAVITSPPYMNCLDYVRDNRLRIWFIKKEVPSHLEIPKARREESFRLLLAAAFRRILPSVEVSGYAALVLGDSARGEKRLNTALLAKELIGSIPGWHLLAETESPIPKSRRSLRGARGTLTEVILIFQRGCDAN